MVFEPMISCSLDARDILILISCCSNGSFVDEFEREEKGSYVEFLCMERGLSVHYLETGTDRKEVARVL
jgi:hypothetical protein